MARDKEDDKQAVMEQGRASKKGGKKGEKRGREEGGGGGCVVWREKHQTRRGSDGPLHLKISRGKDDEKWVGEEEARKHRRPGSRKPTKETACFRDFISPSSLAVTEQTPISVCYVREYSALSSRDEEAVIAKIERIDHLRPS